jgi:hypothetical protein
MTESSDDDSNSSFFKKARPGPRRPLDSMQPGTHAIMLENRKNEVVLYCMDEMSRPIIFRLSANENTPRMIKEKLHFLISL